MNREILALAPALLSPVTKANWSTESPVRIGARRYNGATYVIAVNTATTSEATASFSLPGLGSRKLRVFRDGRIVKPFGELVTDKLARPRRRRVRRAAWRLVVGLQSTREPEHREELWVAGESGDAWTSAPFSEKTITPYASNAPSSLAR